MDEIKSKIEEVVKKLTSDKNLADEFKKNPISVIEKVLGVDLPDDVIKNVVEGVKAKMSIDNAKSLFDKAKDLFNK